MILNPQETRNMKELIRLNIMKANIAMPDKVLNALTDLLFIQFIQFHNTIEETDADDKKIYL